MSYQVTLSLTLTNCKSVNARCFPQAQPYDEVLRLWPGCVKIDKFLEIFVGLLHLDRVRIRLARHDVHYFQIKIARAQAGRSTN